MSSHPHPSQPQLLFFLNAPATPAIYTLSLHDALPISRWSRGCHRHTQGQWLELRASARADRNALDPAGVCSAFHRGEPPHAVDRKSTRLNSSHPSISYAVFCLKKKKTTCTRSV